MLLLGSPFHGARQAFTCHLAHASAEESEVESGDLDVDITDARATRNYRFVTAALRASLVECVGIALEGQRVARRELVVRYVERVAVDEVRDALDGRFQGSLLKVTC